jgi:hypothetical protein
MVTVISRDDAGGWRAVTCGGGGAHAVVLVLKQRGEEGELTSEDLLRLANAAL